MVDAAPPRGYRRSPRRRSRSEGDALHGPVLGRTTPFAFLGEDPPIGEQLPAPHPGRLAPLDGAGQAGLDETAVAADRLRPTDVGDLVGEEKFRGSTRTVPAACLVPVGLLLGVVVERIGGEHLALPFLWCSFLCRDNEKGRREIPTAFRALHPNVGGTYPVHRSRELVGRRPRMPVAGLSCVEWARPAEQLGSGPSTPAGCAHPPVGRGEVNARE